LNLDKQNHTENKVSEKKHLKNRISNKNQAKVTAFLPRLTGL